VSVIFLDVDHFKRLNDEHGHGRGDEVLSGIGARLREAAEDALCVARTGGEVFAVIAEVDERAALALAEKLLAVIRVSPIVGVRVTASAGVATAKDAIGSRELLRDADEALYRAKARGRDRAESAEGLRRESAEEGTDAQLESFEDFTRVIAERVADVIAWRGRRLFTELRMQADVDALTKLFSRRYLDRRLPFEISEAEQRGTVLTVAMMDLDHFGEINKAHGWPTGDRVLTELAEVVKRHVRSSDWVARYGGEEICVVLTETRLDEAELILERIRRAVEAHVVESTRGARIQVTLSVGAAERATGDDVEAILDRASQALLAAKNAGRTRVHARPV
jgi:diguanylate cyclase (GGDEF)-like protein